MRGAQLRIGIVAGSLKRRNGIATMNCRGRDPRALAKRAVGSKQRPNVRRGLFIRKPAESGGKAADRVGGLRILGRRLGGADNRIKQFVQLGFVIGFECDGGSREDFTRIGPGDQWKPNLPALGSGNAEPVEVSFEAVVKISEVGKLLGGAAPIISRWFQRMAASSKCCSMMSGMIVVMRW